MKKVMVDIRDLNFAQNILSEYFEKRTTTVLEDYLAGALCAILKSARAVESKKRKGK